MNFKEYRTNLSLIFETSEALICFGFSPLTKEDIEKSFPNIHFCYIQQTHSSTVVNASQVSLPSADAHYTDKIHYAPMIQTADCLPILVISPQFVLSIHAGWRGVENGIITNSLSTLKGQFSFNESISAFIGPHIATKSFEVGHDVGGSLLKAYHSAGGQDDNKILFKHPDPNKVFVDLQKIATRQLCTSGLLEKNIYDVGIDTFSSSYLHSYRREKSPGRQWSFCFLKNKT